MNTPFGDIEIIYTGLRPGEKLFEELLIGDNITEIDHEKIMRAEEEVIEWKQLSLLIQQLKNAKENCNYELMRSTLISAVSGYEPQCKIVDEVTLAQNNRTNKLSNVIQI